MKPSWISRQWEFIFNLQEYIKDSPIVFNLHSLIAYRHISCCRLSPLKNVVEPDMCPAEWNDSQKYVSIHRLNHLLFLEKLICGISRNPWNDQIQSGLNTKFHKASSSLHGLPKSHHTLHVLSSIWDTNCNKTMWAFHFMHSGHLQLSKDS